MKYEVNVHLVLMFGVQVAPGFWVVLVVPSESEGR